MALAKPAQAQGSWIWHPQKGRLEIEAPSGTPLTDLGGVWSIDALEKMLEGLSRGRLKKVFAPGDGPVPAARCACPNGQDVHLVGMFHQRDRGARHAADRRDFPEI